MTDVDLLRRVDDGDTEALARVVDAHLHPAWRVALVAAPDQVVAERAVVEGFADGLAAAIRQPDPRLGIRGRLVAATRHAATTGVPDGPGWAVEPDPVLGAFRALPEAWRTALWLVEVEGGSPEQVGPVLGLNRAAAAALADRAAAGLRDRLAADVAERATDPACRRALAKLPAHAAGKLTAAERDAVGAHLAGCGTCAVWLAALVSPRPALRRLVVPPPAALATDIEARWLAVLAGRSGGWLQPLTERAVGAAAAAVLAIGLGGAALLGGRDRGDAQPELALPSSAEIEGGDLPAGNGSTGGATSSGTGGTGGTGGSTTGGTGGTGGSGGGPLVPTGPSGGSGGGTGSLLLGTGGGTGDQPRSVTTPTAPAPTTPPTTTPPGEEPPAQQEGTTLGVPGVVEVELAPEQGTVGVDVLGGTATLGLGGPDLVEVSVPGIL